MNDLISVVAVCGSFTDCYT